ncbi:MAG TPA: thioesterase family protein [Acidimicrobiales bacterium]
MGDLEKDTALEPVADGRYTAELREDWNIWGPNGGYVASVALRAAGLTTGRARPASIVAHFLGVAAFDRVNVDVAVLRGSRFATSARVSITQGGRPVLEALVWGVDPGGAALEHDIAPAPEVPPPSEVPSWEERMADVDPADRPPFRFWDNIEHRPLQWRDDWPPPEPASPEGRWWFRFRPTPLFDDPWVDACRLLIPVDTMGWPAAFPAHAHVDPPEVIAPTVDLSAHFHRPATGEEWLLCDAVSPVAAGGLVAATVRVWGRSGALLASGDQSMLCRPAPRTS